MIFKGNLIAGDFQDKIMTFEIEGEMTLQRGNYTILPTKMYEELVNGAESELKALHIDSVMDCSTCKHREFSKYVAPCYGCRDNNGYDNWTSAIVP